MSAPREILTSADVARRLRRSLRWFLRQRADLEARGFPAPIDGLGMRWDSAAIDDWLDRQRPARPVDPAAGMEAELIRRAGALAPAEAELTGCKYSGLVLETR